MLLLILPFIASLSIKWNPPRVTNRQTIAFVQLIHDFSTKSIHQKHHDPVHSAAGQSDKYVVGECAHP